MPSKKTKPGKPKEARVTLDVEDIRVDASPEALASMMSALIHIPSYRKNFERNPVAHLKECGISVPSSVGKQITPESIRLTLDELTEGSEARATAAVLPAVAVGVRVGTAPGTSPAVAVGIHAGVNTTVFATVRTAGVAEERPGLSGRQKGQAVKREKRPKTEKPE